MSPCEHSSVADTETVTEDVTAQEVGREILLLLDGLISSSSSPPPRAHWSPMELSDPKHAILAPLKSALSLDNRSWPGPTASVGGGCYEYCRGQTV